ncbi:hypothetical protein ACF0H5_022436 [Mactra antiquata]
MADREALSKNISLSDVLRIQALFRGALVRKQLQDVKRSFEAVFSEIERTDSDIIDLESLVSVPKVWKKSARKEIKSRQKVSVPHGEPLSNGNEVQVHNEHAIDTDKDSGRFNSVEVQTSFIDLKTEPFKVPENENDDNVLDNLDTSWKDRVIPFIQNEEFNDDDGKGKVADELHLDLNTDRNTGSGSNINSGRSDRLASCDRQSEHTGRNYEHNDKLDDFDRRSELSLSDVDSNLQRSTPRSVRSAESPREVNRDPGYHGDKRSHGGKSNRSVEENVSVRSKKQVETFESEVEERLSHRSEKRSVKSDNSQRSGRPDSGQKSVRSDSGQKSARSDSGQKSVRSDCGPRSARSDSGRMSGRRDDEEFKNQREYENTGKYETESGQGQMGSRSNSERSLRSERSNYVNERNSPRVQSGRSERSNKSAKSSRIEPHSDESRSRSKNRDRQLDRESIEDGSMTNRSDRSAESGHKSDRSDGSSRPRSAKSHQEMTNEKMIEVMPPRSTSPAPAHSLHHGNRQQIHDSTTLTNVTSVWDSVNSEHGSKSFAITDSLPQDAASLKELRKNISMELLWVQQAIDSRKNYLNLKRKM